MKSCPEITKLHYFRHRNP